MQRVTIETSKSGRRTGWITENGQKRRIPVKEAEAFLQLQKDWVFSFKLPNPEDTTLSPQLHLELSRR